jgi:hypothetical protein
LNARIDQWSWKALALIWRLFGAPGVTGSRTIQILKFSAWSQAQTVLYSQLHRCYLYNTYLLLTTTKISNTVRPQRQHNPTRAHALQARKKPKPPYSPLPPFHHRRPLTPPVEQRLPPASCGSIFGSAAVRWNRADHSLSCLVSYLLRARGTKTSQVPCLHLLCAMVLWERQDRRHIAVKEEDGLGRYQEVGVVRGDE